MTDHSKTPALDLAEMRRVAEAATPGPWMVSGIRYKLVNYDRAQAHLIGPDGDGVALVLYEEKHHAQHWADAKFVATFDPPTVKALIVRSERADTIAKAAIQASGLVELVEREYARLKPGDLQDYRCLTDFGRGELAMVERLRAALAKLKGQSNG
jgi:hypothetical protein